MNYDIVRIDKLIRTHRKTIALIVNEDAELIVRAPMTVTDLYIQKLVHEKTVWISEKITEVRSRKFFPARGFIEGETFLYLGVNYPLSFGTGMEVGVEITDKLVVSCGDLPVRDVLLSWYHVQASEKIQESCNRYLSITGLRPNAVKISNARKRWGSCSCQGSLNFSWRLVMAPMDVIDYVVLHELMHLKEPNHSNRFWNNVKSVMPDFNIHKKWLKDNGRYLDI